MFRKKVTPKPRRHCERSVAVRPCLRHNSLNWIASSALKGLLAMTGAWELRKKLLIAALLALAGCATQFENQPLVQKESNEERREVNVLHKERPVILVALSGGGARAADLGWVVLQELKKFHYWDRGQARRLIDDIAVVSSVSGGSVIAAYYGLYGPDGLDQFESAFLARENMGELFSSSLNPFTRLNLAFMGAGKTDLVREMFDEQLFHGTTFAELNRKGKPFIILNTTDMTSGEIFSLTPARFDDICSDFDNLPIATGVAASSAVPVLLSPVAFQNYTPIHCAGRPVPAWIDVALKGKYEPYLNIENYKRARYANDLRHGPGRFSDIRYLYLVDGGLADNLGVQGLLEAVASPRGTGDILKLINDGSIQKLVVIVVNARAEKPNGAYESPDRPGVVDMINSVVSVPISSATSNVNARLDDVLTDLKKARRKAPKHNRLRDLEIYHVQIDLDHLRGRDPAQRALYNKAKGIPTSWTISAEDRETVRAAGELLLRQHPCFQKLLQDMKIDAPFIDHAYAETACAP